jgi:hypothetical protein
MDETTTIDGVRCLKTHPSLLEGLFGVFIELPLQCTAAEIDPAQASAHLFNCGWGFLGGFRNKIGSLGPTSQENIDSLKPI